MEYIISRALIVILPLSMGGCTLVPDLELEPHSEENGVNYQYYNNQIKSNVVFYSSAEDNVSAPSLISEYLRKLIETAKVNNADMHYYDSRIKELAILSDISNLERLPNATLSGGVKRTEMPASTSPLGNKAISNAYTMDVGVSRFEFDFWGKLENNYKVRLADYFAETNNKEFAASELILKVVATYYGIVAEREKVAAYTKLLQSVKKNLALNKNAYSKKALSDYELIQSQIIYLDTSAQIDSAKLAIMRDINKLEYLVGEKIDQDKIESYINTSDFQSNVNIGTVEGVIKRRNDIISSEYALIGANYSVGAARANLLPSINLTAISSLASYKYANFFTSNSQGWNLGLGIDIPIFDFGKRNMNIKFNEQKKNSAYIKYNDTVKKALTEINDSLIGMAFSDYFAIEYGKKNLLDEKRYQYANMLYSEGVSDYSPVMTSGQDLIASESKFINAKLDYVKSYYTLHQRLGSLRY
ncbi:TolC family protein [Aeromonas jandaei]